jgi:heavy metal translocating P-type ATPase
MISELSGSKNPEDFKNTDLFRKCRDMGIIPRSEEEIPGETIAKEMILPEADIQPDKAQIGLNLQITDMWCPACAWFIETALKKDLWIQNATCNFSTDRLFVAYDPIVASPEKIIQSIKNLGYHAMLPGEDEGRRETRRMFVRLMICLLLTVNIMMLSFAVYSGFFMDLSKDAVWKIAWPVCLMAAVVIFYGGQPIYRKAFAGLKSFSFGMETLITAGAFTAFFYSFANLVSGSIHLYFDTASMLITLTLLGKMLERRVKDRVMADLDSFFSLRSGKARIVSKDYPEGRYVSIEAVVKEDILRVESGEIVPADGMVVTGRGFVDESLLTGEPKPLQKGPGDAITGGTRVVEGDLEFTVAGIGDTSCLGRMLDIMESGVNRKMAVEQYAERILKWFVPGILLLAAGTGLACFLMGMSPENAMVRAVTVMVIACPCALGIAIPLVRVAAISIAGKKGLLVRNFESFYAMEKVDTFIFDKTGTLTQGGWELLKVEPGEGYDESMLLQTALGLEKDSDHDIAFALKRYGVYKGLVPAEVEDLESLPGGISGVVHGRKVKIGSLAFLANQGISMQGDVSISDPSTGSFYSTVALSINGKIAGIFVFGDRLRQKSRKVVDELKNRGYNLHLVSGDGDRITRQVGGSLGILNVSGGRLPEEKALLVRDLKEKGFCIAMVGDGMNDAPAMAEADVGFAMVNKSHLGRESADITLVHGNLEALLEFIGLAEKVRRKIRQNFWFAFVYNFISIPIAMSGLLTPLIAVTAMLISSLTVITNTLFLFRNRDSIQKEKRF